MLQYEQIDVSAGIDINKASLSKECEFCHYSFFKDVGFRFKEHVCNECHDLLMTGYEFKKNVILSAKGTAFNCILWGISKDETFNWLNNSVLEDKGVL